MLSNSIFAQLLGHKFQLMSHFLWQCITVPNTFQGYTVHIPHFPIPDSDFQLSFHFGLAIRIFNLYDFLILLYMYTIIYIYYFIYHVEGSVENLNSGLQFCL